MRFPFLSSKPTVSVGIDISHSAVKILALGRHSGQFYVENFGIVPLPPGTIVENIIRMADTVSETIARAISEMNLTAKEAVVALPDSTVIQKVIEVDASLKGEELEEEIYIEAEKYVPFPMNEVSLDFEIQGVGKDLSRNRVLLVASRKKLVEERAMAITMAGLTASAVEVECFAVERVCKVMSHRLVEEGRDQTIAVIDLGAQAMKLTIVHDLQAIFTREEIFGGDQLTKEIQRHYGYEEAQADQLKLGKVAYPDDYESKVLIPHRELMLLQIKRTLQFYLSLHSSAKLDQIVLTGGGANMAGIAEFLSERLSIPAIVATLFDRITARKRTNAALLLEQASSLTTCCGLALRNFLK